MKISGEYAMTDTGVIVEGQIHNTHIAETREAFKEHGPGWLTSMYLGSCPSPAGETMLDTPQYGEVYSMLGGNWFTRMCNLASNQMSIEQIDALLGLKYSAASIDVNMSMRRSGILVETNSYILLRVMQLRIVDGEYRGHTQKAHLLNVGWIFDKVQSDGSFKVELLGLTNRHIMTMMMTNLTKYVKLLDSECVLNLVKNPENLRYTQRMGVW